MVILRPFYAIDSKNCRQYLTIYKIGHGYVSMILESYISLENGLSFDNSQDNSFVIIG